MAVGRNEPCPCGSGKKYKKCCIDKSLIGGRIDWEQNVDIILANTRFVDKEKIIIKSVYFGVLGFMLEEKMSGGCHSTSSVLYVLLSELGLSPQLFIGEVSYPNIVHPFDHSWVEIDNQIFDIAISKPLTIGTEQSPVFYGKKLSNTENVMANYGISHSGLDPIATYIYSMDFGKYLDDYPDKNGEDLWDAIINISNNFGLVLSKEAIKDKYYNTERIYKK